MTFIIARKIDNKIIIHSDSKVFSPEELLRGMDNNVLKSVILHSSLCISFAGSIGRAQAAIESLNIQYAVTPDLDDVLKQLLSAHENGNYNPDFIVASLLPNPCLFVIKNGVIRSDQTNGWIGNVDAFEEYQKLYHSNKSNYTSEEFKYKEYIQVNAQMSKAFNIILRSSSFEDVGGFCVTVLNEDDGFRYRENAMASIVDQTIPSGVPTTLRFGTAAEGGYAYTIDSAGEPCLRSTGLKRTNDHWWLWSRVCSRI